jgi:hypothetical protein
LPEQHEDKILQNDCNHIGLNDKAGNRRETVAGQYVHIPRLLNYFSLTLAESTLLKEVAAAG